MIPIITRHWWALVLRGLIAVAFGVLALAFPPLTFEFLAIFLAAYLAIDGIMAVVAGVRAAESHRRWWPFLLEGVLDLLAGAIVYLQPAVLIALVAVWAILTGLLMLIPAFGLPRDSGRWWLILNGAISLLLGIVVIAMPIAGVVYIVLSIAIYAILFGIGLIVLGFGVRKQHGAPAAI